MHGRPLDEDEGAHQVLPRPSNRASDEAKVKAILKHISRANYVFQYLGDNDVSAAYTAAVGRVHQWR